MAARRLASQAVPFFPAFRITGRNNMRSVFTGLKGILVLGALLLAGAAPAYALGAKALLAAGVVTVSGGQAARSASISWEGVVMTTANRGGSFAFETTIVPADCIGTVNDGTSSVDVRIDGCGDGATGLPGTGQTISYAPGDDGDIRAGGALSYMDNGDGTVTDNRTGLTWEKKTDANVATNYTWAGALDYVAALNAMNGGAGFAGHNDWRLPNIKELLSIVDYGRFNPSIDPVFGPTAGGSNFAAYWSSTSWAAFYPEYSAWSVEFLDYYGNSAGALVFGKSSALRVRAVRGGL
jgi:hypothetical protein